MSDGLPDGTNLTQTDINIIKDIIAHTIEKAFEDHANYCRFKRIDVEDMSHFTGVLKDLSGGDTPNASKGIEVLRDNHKWVIKYRKTCEGVGSAIVMGIVAILTGGIATSFWLGFKKLTGE